ncbi:hypothetical protein [Kineosporia sp. NBRC 101731]|uniref:hypothetical protein n=1 Tax=Kineosporia sp. NBRC 101731 TaxID=3032199 RepID=UPI0024A0D610|nr:hypothetical protein [Kineosporia sp. NBRC 101731]GLY33422.1 hypothetical protein Kisp02_67870 [Kineosporia sp. NBRC 101731]
MSFTPENATELDRLKADFTATGERSIEVADRIDEPRPLHDSIPLVLVHSDPATDFTLIGPITANDPRIEEYIDTHLRDTPWWYVPLQPVPTPQSMHEFTVRITQPDGSADRVWAALHEAVAGLIDTLDAARVSVGYSPILAD